MLNVLKVNVELSTKQYKNLKWYVNNFTFVEAKKVKSHRGREYNKISSSPFSDFNHLTNEQNSSTDFKDELCDCQITTKKKTHSNNSLTNENSIIHKINQIFRKKTGWSSIYFGKGPISIHNLLQKMTFRLKYCLNKLKYEENVFNQIQFKIHFCVLLI